MQYQEALAYLQNLTKFGFNFGLERITELLRRLGNPHRHLKVVHVGGTNGKGSTVAMLDSMLRAAGWRVGTFTSPHLHRYTERYRINGEEIAEERVAELIARLQPHLDAMVAEGFEHPTEFEVSTAMAMQYFYEEKVDFLVLEVGLGGAIDSTNVVTPLVAVITNVAMDHMDYLGHTVEEIASVKAGIIKRKVPVVTAARDPAALAVIRKAAADQDARLVEVGRDITWQALDHGPGGQGLTIYGMAGTYENLYLPLLGRHQLVNAATAVAAAELLAVVADFSLTPQAVREGLARTVWPARLEVVRTRPTVLIDGAHNHDGALALRQALEDYFPRQEKVFVLGILGDKERTKVVETLMPLARAVVVTRPNSPRAGDWQQVAAVCAQLVPEVYVIEDITRAVDKALTLTKPDELLCITGSLYMVAEARALFL